MERQLPIAVGSGTDPASGGLSLRQSLGLVAVGMVFLGALALPEEFYRSLRSHDGVSDTADFRWEEVEKGYAIGRFELGPSHQVLQAEVLLLRFDPRYFTLRLSSASEINEQTADLRDLTLKTGGVAGINASFFDQQGGPLGLVIQDGQLRHRIQHGGKLLTGVFYLTDQQPFIVPRNEFKKWDAECAFQSGPRLIVNGKPVKVSEPQDQTRRSGIAITRKGEVIIYATYLRFPGATLEQIQKMLLSPALDVVAALNLDGGGSSQLFVRKNPRSADDTFITGGDLVPLGLVVKKRL